MDAIVGADVIGEIATGVVTEIVVGIAAGTVAEIAAAEKLARWRVARVLDLVKLATNAMSQGREREIGRANGARNRKARRTVTSDATQAVQSTFSMVWILCLLRTKLRCRTLSYRCSKLVQPLPCLR